MSDVFEVVIDHNARDHKAQIDRAAARLRAWAARHGARNLVREEWPVRPGVVRVRFSPNRSPVTNKAADRLTLSSARTGHRHAPGCGCGR